MAVNVVSIYKNRNKLLERKCNTESRALFQIKLVFLAIMTVTLCVPINFANANDSELTCSAVKNIFESRGMLSSVEIQSKPVSAGSALCGCCGERSAAALGTLARVQLQAAVRDALNKLADVLGARAKRFDDFFKKLLTQSKLEFHQMFMRTYGMIYERHSYVFTDLFAELERYYAHGDVDLVRIMDNFFNVLYQKMFIVLNAQYHFDAKYLQCASEHMRDIQPFDDVPHKLSVQLRRAFVATRTFQKALQAGSEVTKSMNEVGFSPECIDALVRMRWCGTCSGLGEERACVRYCHNTMRGCLPLHADIAHDWDAFVDAVDKVSDRLLGPFNIAMVVEPIDIKISEAIMIFQEHSQQISQKIFTGCGKPVLGQVPTSSSSGTSGYFAPPKREKRYVPNDEYIFDNGHNSDDFEFEGSYKSIVDENPFLLSKSSEEYDLDVIDDLKKQTELRTRFLKYMRGQINSVELYGEDDNTRQKREANPEPKGSKEIDFEPYDFESSQLGSKRKNVRKQGGQKKTLVSQGAGNTASESILATGAGASGPSLDKLVKEARTRVRAARRYWHHLPYLLCTDLTPPIDTAPCYNGSHIANYVLPAAGDGMAALASNPSVRASPPTRISVLETQQSTLRAITTKLKNAYNGLEVNWDDYDDNVNLFYGSGSGSGDHGDEETDDDEDHHRIPPASPDQKPTDELGSGDGSDFVIHGEDKEVDESDVRRIVPGVESINPSADDREPNEIEDEEEEADLPPGRGHQPPPGVVKPSVSGASTRQEMSLHRALFTYVFPIVCAWFGGIVNDLV